MTGGQFGLNVKSRLFCVSNMPVSADKGTDRQTFSQNIACRS